MTGENTSAVAATDHRLSIRRTEFGVRGAYLNAIDRFRGAQLAAIFSSHLASVSNDVARSKAANRNGNPHGVVVDATAPVSIAVGFDGCYGAADVFSGVVSAVLQNGCNVVDAGRCTTASLLNVSRRYPHLCGSLLVTGANGKSGDIGLDAFDPHGQGIAVPWQNYGVSVRLQQAATESASGYRSGARQELRPTAENAAESLDDFRYVRVSGQSAGATAAGLPVETPALSTAIDDRLRDLRLADTPPDESHAVSRDDTPTTTILQLPELHQSGGKVFRAGRRSGSLSAVTAEQFYQNWLLRWWPVHSRQSACFRVHDEPHF